MTINLLCARCNSEFEKTICDECWHRLMEDKKRADDAQGDTPTIPLEEKIEDLLNG